MTGRTVFAIPLAQGALCNHFGHCEQFAVMEIELQERRLLERQDLQAPPHEPGLLPRWLAGHGVQMVISGGMGQRAQQLFLENGIKVFTGAPSAPPEQLVHHFMHGSLSLGANLCDH